MISEKMEDLLNEQIQKELYSSYLYLSFEAYFASRNLDGFAHWFRVQAMEERDHALIFFNYINQVGGRVKLQAIPAPEWEFSTIEEVIQKQVDHERLVTALIYHIADQAIEERDHKTSSFIKWFIDEQAEEEANAEQSLSKIRLIGENDGRGILMLDAEMGARVYAVAAPLAAGNQAG
ncbi:Ferroxidase [Syntrophobotulus glycolicus DSM 8271]|uniref:Ferritin n=1 Tax=Syntrophobotulus glycolicus (strain DSM 8271 / FlGlyR) TaxID=645991 RepID=F0T2E7_SYNGF|nr:ferritin [Syntrophobotulus glycolicus]ADY55265.1 Ferroxidase [Syntrophobotulus glycolicus DSM 8271]